MKKLLSSICFVSDMIRTHQERRIGRSAAEFAYFMTLSIFPLLICAVAILANFEMSMEGLFAGLWASEVVGTVLGYVSHAGEVPTQLILTVSITVIVTSGSAAFRAVAKSMEEIQGKPRYAGLWGFVFSFVFSLLLLFTVYFSVLMITTGAWLMETVEALTGLYGLALFWRRIRFPLLFAIVVLVVHLIYTFTAPKELQIRRLPGAILATIALVAGSMIFSGFMAVSARYPLVYGSLASFILLMVWCHLCGNILIIGNLFNYVRYQRKHPG